MRRDDFPFWGRFKRMAELRQSGQRPPVETVMKYAPNLRGDVESYAWSWALVVMFSAYPEYRELLKQAAAHGPDTDKQFNRWFYEHLREDWPRFQARWYNLIEDLDYGYDLSREQIDVSQSDPIWDQRPRRLTIEADRGWQSTGVRYRKGTRVMIKATGQVILNDQPKPWISHPDGVTIEYHAGQPIGQLLARIVPNAPAKSGPLPPLETLRVGTETTIWFDQPAWLLLRVNDHLDGVANNTGSYQVKIEAEKAQ